MEIYLDNSATTKCDDAVKELVVKILTEDYGNPSSLHRKGIEAENHVKKAASRIAKTLHCREKEIIFTSGGTESNNMALIGAARANQRKGKHIITTDIEHPSVRNACEHLKEEGFRITYIQPDASGTVSPEAVAAAVCEDTILVSVMLVNNEMGALEPAADISAAAKRKNPGVLMHVDAVQAYGKFRIHPKQMGIDLLSVSGHKIHGPKGIGFLYVKEGTKIRPICYGGGQQKGMRSGTLNVPGIAGMGLAAELSYRDLEEKVSAMYALRSGFMKQMKEIPDVVFNSPEGTGCAPQIVNISFPGIRSEVMLHALEDRGIYVSSGSACASNHPGEGSTLMKLGKPKEITDSALRFSFSFATSREELDQTAQAIRELAPALRKFIRR
jgi:cysteine desulfurase